MTSGRTPAGEARRYARLSMLFACIAVVFAIASLILQALGL